MIVGKGGADVARLVHGGKWQRLMLRCGPRSAAFRSQLASLKWSRGGFFFSLLLDHHVAGSDKTQIPSHPLKPPFHTPVLSLGDIATLFRRSRPLAMPGSTLWCCPCHVLR